MNLSVTSETIPDLSHQVAKQIASGAFGNLHNMRVADLGNLPDEEALRFDISDDLVPSSPCPSPSAAASPPTRYCGRNIHRRRLQNRRSAQACRQRKTQHFSSLKQEMSHLEQDNAHLEREKRILMEKQETLRRRLDVMNSLVMKHLGLDTSDLFADRL